MTNMDTMEFKNSLIGEKYTRYVHPSGLKIYVFPKKLTTFYAILGVKYGSIHTDNATLNGVKLQPLPEGIAHFLEHKLFANPDGSDALEQFSPLGADANAYTSFNKTAYLFSATENFYDSLRELITFVTHPHFTDENVSSEIGIIAEEIKMYDDSPSDRCFYGMLEGMYEHHPIRQNICGTQESISKITPQILYECYNSFYNLSNMALFICGDVDDERIIAIANELLPDVASPFNVCFENDNENESPNAYKTYVEEKMQVSKPIFNIGIKDTEIPSDAYERQKKDAVLSILDEMIFSRAGELYSSLLEQDIISPNFSYGYTIAPTVAYNSIAGEADDPNLVLEKILEFIEELKKSGLSKSDFLRGKRVMYAEFIKSFDSTESIANNLISFTFDDCELLSYVEILNSITFEDVEQAFALAFEKKKITLSVILPLEN